MARRRRGQDISGFVLVDKPQGPTSNQVLQRVRGLFDARKAGHTGTLDPLATGMLPVCFGAATRVAALAIQASKRYEATGLLGVATDTGDAMGAVTQRLETAAIAPADIAVAAQGFIGESEQIPPRYSAVRHAGRRMYELARKGIEVDCAPRRISIHDIELCSVSWPLFTLRVHCSKGTYIRTLVEDIGRVLGTVAHVTALRRLSVDPFTGADMVTVDEIEAAGTPQARRERFMMPIDSVLQEWPRIALDAAQAERIRQGQRIALEQSRDSGRYRLYGADQEFVGIGEVTAAAELLPRQIFV